jgi:predicted CxxxxCH...CXXCH cytochrome family protein
MIGLDPGKSTARDALVALACAALTGCLEVRGQDADAGGDGCTMCHEMDVTSGAHTAHLADAGIWGGVGLACADCHPIPSDWFVEGHLNARVDVVFPDGGLATAGGAEPTYDGASCHEVYCHGGTLTGGNVEAPKWNEPGPLTCGDCHGIPPLAPHTPDTGCAACHADAYADGGLDAEIHINGIVDFGQGDGGV